NVESSIPLSYQWSRNGVSMDGEVDRILTLHADNGAADGDQYAVTVVSYGEVVESESASLSIVEAISLWLRTYFSESKWDEPLVMSKFADPDHDRVPNFFEYIFGTDPSR
ncbi:hypothetical protein QEH59_18860, partial [Coraliomargarita sp. SDUM461004]